MNQKIASLLALCAMASGFTTLRGAEAFTAYRLNITFTNAEAAYWSVNGAPKTTGTLFTQILPSSTSVQTDNSGKISGNGMLTVLYNTAGVPYSTFAVSYSGQITAPAGSAPTVTMSIHGAGFTIDGTGQPTTALNSISLKFVGQPGLFNGQTNILGQFSGSIRGKTPLSDTSANLPPSLQAVIPASSLSYVTVSTDVVQSQKRMLFFDNGATGSGSIGSSDSFRFNYFGTGDNHGEVLLASGVLGPYTNVINSSNVTFLAPVSVQFKGKVEGQVVSSSASSGQFNPPPRLMR
jgi:hypothetical protein